MQCNRTLQSSTVPARHAAPSGSSARMSHTASWNGIKHRPGLVKVAIKGAEAVASDSDVPPPATVPAHVDSSGQGSCPFLAALPRPPPAQHKWWQRPQQMSNPAAFQAAALGSSQRVVLAASELGLAQQTLVGDGDLARTVLGAEGDFIRQGSFLKGFEFLVGEESLLTAQDPQHKYLRGLIMPAFEKASIAKLVPRMEHIVSKYLKQWSEETGNSGQTIQGADACKTLTFGFIINVILGRDFPEAELSSLIKTYKVWAEGLLAWPYINLPFTRFGRAMAARQQLIQVLQVEIDQAHAVMAAGQTPAGILGSFVTAVDEHGNRLTNQQVLDNLLLLLLAGHDTSAITLTNILAELQRHPAVVQKLRDEQQRIVQQHGEVVTTAALRDMEYAEAVIRETLRLSPIVANLSRQASRDFELDGYLVKEGEFVVPLLMNIAMQDPRWLDDTPEAFRPERMMTPEGQKQGWQLPFGHGPRFCAGYAVAMAEMKTFLALLARDYSFTADINTKWVQRLGKVPANGLPMKVTPLKDGV